MITITETDGGKWALCFEPTAYERTRGAQTQKLGLFTTRAAAERARTAEAQRFGLS